MLVELFCGALLSSFLQVLFDRLLSRQVLDYIRGRKLDEMLPVLNNLKLTLLSINAVVDDAEQKQFSDSYVKAWLDEVKGKVFDAEDVLDEIDYELSKSKLEAESHMSTSKVSNFESRMENVLKDLKLLSDQKDHLGLKNASSFEFGSGMGSKLSQKLPSTSLLVESVIYGREDDKKIIFNWVIPDNPNQLSILSIVGMGGVGKTTLVQHVYNHPKMEEATFDIKAWVCVSDDFDVLTVSRAILEAITNSKDDSGNLEMVHGKLKAKLTGKKFLLVLDDVWNERREKWEAVKTPLTYGAKGSIILVTTRSEKVASIMRSNKVHHLKQLQEDHCWDVFAKHALQDHDHEVNFELKEIGIKIVEKCKGLPLALKTIGSLLHTKVSISEWKRVMSSKIWDLPKEDSEVIPALLLSYHHLPSHLKRCFAYCALFPKDYVFVKKCLIQLWMTENFLQCPQQSKSPEEVGEQYFDDLLSRSFFQKSSKYETSFVMHDLLNDLAKYVCGDFCFRLGVDKAESIPKTTRHFSFAINHDHNFDVFWGLSDAERLRTFMPTNVEFNFGSWLCKMKISELFSKFKFLRNLSLSYCSSLTEVPESIKCLIHLRSLDLSGTYIKKLPKSTCSLYNLQILKLNSCPYLEELPLDLHKLINLRHLEFIDTNVKQVPMHLGNLKNLQVLSSFCVGKKSEFSVQQLGELNLHGRLSLEQLQNIENPSDALAAYLKNKTQLVELALGWNQNGESGDSWKEMKVLENLQPSRHLKKLSISNYGGKVFPNWFIDLSVVVSLSLANCKNCRRLPSFGVLPFLKDLSIEGCSSIVIIGADFYGSNSFSFQSLETLTFSCMYGWEEWECKAAVDAFPRLQHLSITFCPMLKGHLPKQLLGLKKLHISDSKQLVASAPMAPEIHELELQYCGKLQFDYQPTTLKRLTVNGQDMEASLLKSIELIVSNSSHSSLEYLYITDCPSMNISRCYNSLETLTITGDIDCLTTFKLDDFPKLCRLLLRCTNVQKFLLWQPHSHLKDLEICGSCSFEFINPKSQFEFISIEYELESDTSISDFDLNVSKTLFDMKPQFESYFGDGLSLPLQEKCELVNLKSQFESFPSKVLFAPCLERVTIERLENLESLPEILSPSLRELRILDCPKVELLPNGILPSNLKKLVISNCSKLMMSMRRALGANASLEDLYIGRVNVKSFPDKGFVPQSLTSLSIYDCPCLEKLDYQGLLYLFSLKELILHDCPRLQFLPEEGLPRSISTLKISGKCLLKLKSKDWPKIAHIKDVWVQYKQITSASSLKSHMQQFSQVYLH
ncbi:putative disease resistance RPP13-like protein 1, partial [Mucuna pruriens]